MYLLPFPSCTCLGVGLRSHVSMIGELGSRHVAAGSERVEFVAPRFPDRGLDRVSLAPRCWSWLSLAPPFLLAGVNWLSVALLVFPCGGLYR